MKQKLYVFMGYHVMFLIHFSISCNVQVGVNYVSPEKTFAGGNSIRNPFFWLIWNICGIIIIYSHCILQFQNLILLSNYNLVHIDQHFSVHPTFLLFPGVSKNFIHWYTFLIFYFVTPLKKKNNFEADILKLPLF